MLYPQAALEPLLQDSGITFYHFTQQLTLTQLTTFFSAERFVFILPHCAYLLLRQEEQIHCTYLAVEAAADWALPITAAYPQARLRWQQLVDDSSLPVVFAELLLSYGKPLSSLDVQKSLIHHRKLWVNTLARRWPVYHPLLKRLDKYQRLYALQRSLQRFTPNRALWQHYAYQKRLIYRQIQHDTGWQCLSSAQLISLLAAAEIDVVLQRLTELAEQQKQRLQSWEQRQQPLCAWQNYARQIGQQAYQSTLVGLGGELGAGVGQWFSPAIATTLRRGGMGLGLAYSWSLGPYALGKSISLSFAAQQHLRLSRVDDDQAKAHGWVISATHLYYLLLLSTAAVESYLAQDSHVLGMVMLGLTLSAGLGLLLRRLRPEAEQQAWLSGLHLIVWQLSQWLYGGMQDRLRAVERCQYSALQMAQSLTEQGHLVHESQCNVWLPGFWLTGKSRFNLALSTRSHHLRFSCDADKSRCDLQADNLSLPAP